MSHTEIQTVLTDDYVYEVYRDPDGEPTRIIQWDAHEDGPPLLDEQDAFEIDCLCRTIGLYDSVDRHIMRWVNQHDAAHTNREQADQD